MNTPKISVIGAGNVGVRYAYGLMISGLAREIVLVDVDRNRTEGEVLDLGSGMPYVSPVRIMAGDYADIAGSDVVVITAGRRQKPGQTRLDLVRDNVALFKEIIPRIMRFAPEAIQLVVSNPVDVLSYAAFRISGKPWQEVLGSGTVLDSARLRYLLSEHCGLDSRNIHAYILGEHGDSEFPVWSKAMLGTTPLDEYGKSCRRCDHGSKLQEIFEDVRDFAYKVIERKGETSYGIGLALVRITEALVKDEHSILPVSSLVQGMYGAEGLYMSIPAVVGRRGVREVLPLALDDHEQELFKVSAQKLRVVIQEAGI
jgi:L-lactate dehydrogenase